MCHRKTQIKFCSLVFFSRNPQFSTHLLGENTQDFQAQAGRNGRIETVRQAHAIIGNLKLAKLVARSQADGDSAMARLGKRMFEGV